MQHTRMVSVGAIVLLLVGCGSDSTSSDPTSAADSTSATSTTPSAETSRPSTTEQPTTTSAPTTTSTTTLPAGPPVFDPAVLGDNLSLSSFVLTVTVQNTNSGQLSENITTSGFIKDPMSAYELATFASGGTSGGLRKYLVGGRSYEENQFGDWYLFEAGSPTIPNYTGRLDPRSGTLASVLSADLADQSDFAGIPANHFVFDETDLASYASFTPENPAPDVEGDFYLAQDGNFVLYTHSKETSPGRTYEVTEELSSIDQLAEITLPPELAPMTEALDIGVDLASLLPPGSLLSSMKRYAHGIGLDYYVYKSPGTSNEEFGAFFRALPPTNGWTVSHIGHITPHLEPVNCETKLECVILNNGGDQIVIAPGATFTLEFDREHIFTAL